MTGPLIFMATLSVPVVIWYCLKACHVYALPSDPQLIAVPPQPLPFTLIMSGWVGCWTGLGWAECDSAHRRPGIYTRIRHVTGLWAVPGRDPEGGARAVTSALGHGGHALATFLSTEL